MTFSTRASLTVPEDLYQHFEVIGALADITAEQAMAAHLEQTKAFTERNAIYIGEKEATEIRRILGAQAKSGPKIVELLTRLVTVRLGGKKFEISTNRQEALYWMAKSLNKTLDDAMPELLDMALGLLLKC